MKASKVPRAAPSARPRSAAQVRGSLHARLRERRGEIEQAVLTRANAVADPSRIDDPEYAAGLRAAVSAAIDYGLAGVESSERNRPPIPAPLLVQARLAARNGVPLDTVLRRYFAGYALLGDFLIEEAESIGTAALKPLLRTQATLFDRLLAAVSEEHARELEVRPDSTEERRAELVQRLLAGELIDLPDLAYDFNNWHLAVIAVGAGGSEAIRQLAATVDRGLLLVHPAEGTVWAWLAGRRRLDPSELEQLLPSRDVPQITLALGEPAEGLAGWRLTHRQAVAALPVALRSPEHFARYADVALLASALRDDLLATSLEELYLDPLAGEGDDGATLQRTLDAYFASGRNASSAAATLGVSRQTVNSRLRAIEERIGRALETCAVELETVLKLQRLSNRQLH